MGTPNRVGRRIGPRPSKKILEMEVYKANILRENRYSNAQIGKFLGRSASWVLGVVGKQPESITKLTGMRAANDTYIPPEFI